MEFFIMEEPIPAVRVITGGWTIFAKKSGMVFNVRTFWQKPSDQDDEALVKAQEFAHRAAVFFGADPVKRIEVLRRG